MTSPDVPRTADRLIEAAAELLRHTGYAAATTRELAGLLGVQKASPYYHINSKADLLVGIWVQNLDRISGRVDAVSRVPSAREQLPAMIEFHVVTALEDRDMHAVMLIKLRSLSGARLAEVVARRAAYEKLIRNTVRQGQLAAAVRDDVPAKYLSLALLDLLNWTIFWFTPDGDLSPAKLVGTLSSVYLDGVLAHHDW